MALFVCKANSCRSQMAEGWVHTLLPGVAAASAGSDPAADGAINPSAIAVMRERGVDISSHRAKSVAEAVASGGDLRVAITVCAPAAESCPRLLSGTSRAMRIVHVPFDDPPAMPPSGADGLDEYRRVRDEIEAWVRTTLPSLLVAKAAALVVSAPPVAAPLEAAATAASAATGDASRTQSRAATAPVDSAALAVVCNPAATTTPVSSLSSPPRPAPPLVSASLTASSRCGSPCA